MKTDLKAPILAGLGLVSLAIAIPMGVASAQQGDQRVEQRNQTGPPQNFQGDQRVEQRPDRPGLPGQDMMPRMGMMGGGAVMESDSAFLYILQGNMLFKVSKNNLEVVGHGSLPMHGGPGGPGGPGAPGVRGGGGGAGAGGAAQRTTGGETGEEK